jgi:hypothetical protein
LAENLPTINCLKAAVVAVAVAVAVAGEGLRLTA